MDSTPLIDKHSKHPTKQGGATVSASTTAAAAATATAATTTAATTATATAAAAAATAAAATATVTETGVGVKARKLSNNELLKSRCRYRSSTSCELDLNIDNTSSFWMRDYNPTSSINEPFSQNTSIGGEVYSDLSLPVTPQDPSKSASVHFSEKNSNSFVNSSTLEKRTSPERVDGKPNAFLETIQRTHSHLKRTRLIYVFYVVALPIYTVTGALIFQALDGEHDDKLRQEYEGRCKINRQKAMDSLKEFCNITPSNCYMEMEKFINDIDVCYKVWHESHRVVTHSMSDFTNAVVYAFSIYTTIGYGNMAADTTGCRIATIIYGVFGIPLFFASVKEAGNMFRNGFISLYKYIRKLRRRKHLLSTDRNQHNQRDGRKAEQILNHTVAIFVERAQELVVHKNDFERKFSLGSLPGTKNGYITFTEQRRVFFAAIIVFMAYLFIISILFTLLSGWDYFTSLYFLFSSVALIGFGDVFPKEPWIVLLHSPLIVMGVVLFSMCYFILQEEIREKAFEASRKARMSISKYSHTLMTRNPWSRRNSPAFDSASQSPEPTAFERQRKRRQSAPNVLTVPSLNLPGCNL